jgi:AcrR family transcriptional regulator
VARLTRDEKKARTRAALLRAAAGVFARRGFHGASVDAIAEEAGLSAGAVYSNFAGKEELFLTVLEEAAEGWAGLFAESFTQGRTTEERVRATSDAWIAAVQADPEPFLLFVEMWSYAIRTPRLRGELARRVAAIRRVFLDEVRALSDEAGVELPDDVATELATVVDLLGMGFAMRKLLQPDEVPDEMFGVALNRIVQALLARSDPAWSGATASTAPGEQRRRGRS